MRRLRPHYPPEVMYSKLQITKAMAGRVVPRGPAITGHHRPSPGVPRHLRDSDGNVQGAAPLGIVDKRNGHGTRICDGLVLDHDPGIVILFESDRISGGQNELQAAARAP